ncbi:hypothetical protein FHR70_000748 [Microvirga lupini]|uniref:Uncharacterized protein n=1 Tax=Microvirga lupini TaxID=420324 RepID=A0A7W4YW71_9HYPH|nr:hypothetical protein [Microvirga lupini]MBB3017708.1 hypothetical protein [Microvirga lupini]
MAGSSFKISFDLGSKLDVTAIINKQVFPLLNQAVRAVAQQTAAEWQKEVYQAKLWSGEKDAYASTITWKMTGDFTAVIESNYKHDQAIENGRPAYDMKQMLNTSPKVRRTESGKRFLVIPMRHNVKKLQEAGLYEQAQALGASTVASQSTRPSGEVTHLSPKSGMSPSKNQTPFLSSTKTHSAMMVPQNNYAWGQKLSKADAGQHKWAAGMVRFNTSTPGGAKSSAYLTFRVLMEGSTGWVRPAQPGQFLARKVQQKMQPKANAAFAAAIKKQLGG